MLTDAETTAEVPAVTSDPTAVRTDKPRYTSEQLRRRAGISYRQLDHWARTGLLPDNAAGSGSSRSFTQHDVTIARIVKALLDKGFGVRGAFEIARIVVDTGEYVAPLVGPFVFTIQLKDAEAEA